jgi:hypothetical protein
MQLVPTRPVLLLAITLLFIQSCKQNKPHYSLDKKANAAMIHILDSIANKNTTMDNPFSPESQLVFFDAEIKKAANDPYRQAVAQFYKAAVLLKLGREKESVNLFAQLPKNVSAQYAGLNKEVEENFALANLRYGERSNCVTNHVAESCVFPIQKAGMHQDETGSRKAIAIYQDLLAKNPADLGSKWLLNLAYMTLGQYPQKVPAAFLIPGLDKDDSGETLKPFTDIAADLKLDTRNKAGGVVVDDFNNDGYLDIVTSDWGIADGPMHFFINNKNGHFTDITEQAGLTGFNGGLNMIQADYNNDGFIDILVLRGAWMPGPFGKQPNSLLRNNGDCTFTDVTVESGLLSFHPTQTGIWRDFNNDGYLDLFIGNETSNPLDPQPCELFMNNTDGTFTDIAKEAGCGICAFVKGVASADYNNDGLQDLYLSTCSGVRILLKNDGTINGKVHFSDVTLEAGLNDIRIKSFPTWFWDYDNDGWPDIFVCGYQPARNSIAYSLAAEYSGTPDPTASTMYLYHNNHNGTFTNVTAATGLNKSVFAMGANFGDIDNDGYLDMYLGTGNPDYHSLDPSKLYRNIKGVRFADVTTAARVGNLQKGHGVSFADLDNDGDQDIYAEVGGAFPGDAYYNSFYLNPGQNNNHWVTISLQGNEGNYYAIGARLKITFTENGQQRSVYRDVNSGGSFGCSPLRKEIGVGQAEKIDNLTITWPGSGRVQTFTNLPVCRFIKIKQGSSNIEEVNLKVLDLKTSHKDMMACPPLQAQAMN